MDSLSRKKSLRLICGVLLSLLIAAIAGRYLLFQEPPVRESADAITPEEGAGAAVQLSSDEQQKIGVELTEIQPASLNDEIAAIGRVVEAESAMRVVSARDSGRIDRLYVNLTGQTVRVGDPVASIAGSDQTGREGTPVTVRSPVAGIVRARKVSEGQFVQAGDALIELTDPADVWVLADVFDADIARVRPGLTAVVTSDAYPEMKLGGEVTAIGRLSDPQTRTTPVRIQVVGAANRLRPGMIVQTALRVALGNVLTVPQSAVIDTGTAKTVYVAHESGIFERRNIHVGSPVKDRYPVLDGLKSGEKVVTNGAFLIDSQTKLTGGLTGMFGGSKSFSENAPPTTSTNSAYKLTFRIEPDPPQGAKENTIHVSLTDASGKPVLDAQVRLTFTMPAMPAMNMPEMRNKAELKWTGTEYAGPIQIMMAGGWNVGIEARRGNELIATSQSHINAR